MKRIFALFVILFCLSFLPISTSIGHCDPIDEGVTTIVLQPGPTEGKDCTAKYKYPDTNFNGQDLQTGVQTWSPSSAWNGGNGYSFIQFDVNGQPEDPTLVTIRLRNSIFGRSDQGGFYSTGNVFAHKILEPWNETDVTWNRMPSHDPSIISESGVFNVKSDEWIEIDITDIYNEWKAGTPNYGIMLNTEGSDTAGPCYGNREWNCRPGSFYSSDYDVSDHRPALNIVVDLDFPHLTEKIIWQSQRTGNWDIWMMNPDGTEKVQLTFDPGIDAYPIISPDGTKIAFHSDRTGRYEIWLMNPDGGNKTQLTTTGGTSPVWSPDGSKIYFNTLTGWEVLVINADGTGLEYIGALGAAPSIHPDGTKLLYYPKPTSDPNSYDIWTANVNGTDPVNLSNLAGLTGFERPNGRNGWNSSGIILFAAHEPSWKGTLGYGIWWIKEDGSAAGPLLDEPGISESMTAWSPDEQRIAYVSTKATGAYNVWVMDADGTNLQQLTDNAAQDLLPHWGYVDCSPNLDHGLVAYYPFNGNLLDSTGNHNGVDHGDIQFGTGIHGASAIFDGFDDYVHTEPNFEADLTGRPFTWATWVKIDPSFRGEGWIVNNDVHSMNNLLSAVGYDYGYRITTGVHTGPFQGVSAVTSIFDSYDWIHVAVTLDDAALRLYINGSVVDSNLVSYQDIATWGGPFYIGSLPRMGRYIKGELDDLRIYNRALSEKEIGKLYNDNPDSDNDGIPDESDNCQFEPNPDQEDWPDADGLGDICDPDDDNDGIDDVDDNCPLDPNSDQADSDYDSIGDVCDVTFDTGTVVDALETESGSSVETLTQANPPGVNGIIAKLTGNGSVIAKVATAEAEYANGDIDTDTYIDRLSDALVQLDGYDEQLADKIASGKIEEPEASNLQAYSANMKTMINNLINEAASS